MNITILAVGTRGDVQPFVALARGLQRAGHEVRLAAPSNFAAFVAGHGVPYAPLSADYEQLATSEEGKAALAGNPAAILRAMREMPNQVRALLDDAWNAAQGASAIVYHPKALIGADIAEKLGIPAFLALPVPALVPTRAFPMPGLLSRSLGGTLNRASYAVTRTALLPFHAVINDWRRSLNLPPRARFADPSKLNGEPMPLLYAFSRHVIPPPPDWPAHVHVTGYWFLEDQAAIPAPESPLARFLESGPPPIYVGFGSMASRDAERTTNVVLEALARTGQRAVLASGWGGLVAQEMPESICLIESAPHEWLFARVAAVVHHGGAGTTAAGLRAGRPTVICPVSVDQPFWGERVYELGAGPRPLPLKSLNAEALAQAIHSAVHDEAMRRRAAEIATQLQAEDGVAAAVQLVEQQATQPETRR